MTNAKSSIDHYQRRGICKRCDGQGEVLVDPIAYMELGVTDDDGYERCTDCNGSGLNDEECSYVAEPNTGDDGSPSSGADRSPEREDHAIAYPAPRTGASNGSGLHGSRDGAHSPALIPVSGFTPWPITEEMFAAAQAALGVMWLDREAAAKIYTAMRASEKEVDISDNDGLSLARDLAAWVVDNYATHADHKSFRVEAYVRALPAHMRLSTAQGIEARSDATVKQGAAEGESPSDAQNPASGSGQ